MAFRIHLLFVCTALCLLSLYHANAFKAADWPKIEPRLVGFSWSDCGSGSDPVHVKSLSVAPEPVKIPGNLSLSTSVSVGSAIPTDLAIALNMEKKVLGFYITIPCIDNVGSCTYNGICGDWAKACPTYFAKYGIPCTCPIAANTYTVPNTVVDITANIPSIASGSFRLTASFVSASAGHLGCLQLIVDLDT